MLRKGIDLFYTQPSMQTQMLEKFHCNEALHDISMINDKVCKFIIFVSIAHLSGIFYFILEAKHVMSIWIMKIKRPKNQADVIEVPYVH